MSEKKQNVQTLYSWLCLRHELKKSDLIIVCGSYDLRAAEQGAKLWLEGWAPKILFSGGLGNFTAGIFDKPEADVFSDRAKEMGVPEDAILIENESTNSGENIQYSRELLKSLALEPQRIILVQKPNMMRRVFASFSKQWPGPEYICCAMDLNFEDIPHDHMTEEKVICELCGDFQRMVEYPKLGYQIEQEIPPEVQLAWEELIASGFDGHLIK